MLQLKKITCKEDLAFRDYLIVWGGDMYIVYWDKDGESWDEEVVGCFCLDDDDRVYFEEVEEIYEIVKGV